jgi:hypothetical protein
MVSGRILTGIFFSLAILCAVSTAAGQDPTLNDLPGVWVNVDITSALIKDGLGHNQVKSDIESQLREAGVRLLTEKQCRSSAGQPKLLIRVNGTKVQENWKFYTFAINLYLIQDVYLTRTDNSGIYQASTWYNAVAAHGYIGDIRTRIKEMVYSFTNDYQTANP